MYEIFWYGSKSGAFSGLDEACVELYRMFNCTGYALNEADVAAWMQGGSGIKRDGKWLNVYGMLHNGRRLNDVWNSYEFYNSDRFRNGPVIGIRKWRGGYGYHRRIRTMAERRQNMGVRLEEGLTLVRGRRSHLPSSWDDINRTVQHTWKSQHKGKKAWDKSR